MEPAGPTLNRHDIVNSMQDDILDAERTMRACAEHNAQSYLKALLQLVEGIAPAFLEHHSHDPVRSWPPERWLSSIADILIEARTSLKGQIENEHTQTLQRQVADLEKLSASQQQHIERLRQELEKQASAQLSIVRDASPSLESHPPTHLDRSLTLDIPPTPPKAWGSDSLDTYQTDARLIGVIGKSGRCNRPWITREVAAQLGLNSDKPGTVMRAILRCESAGWIEVLKAEGNWARGYPHLLRLSEFGERLYRALLRDEPEINEATRLLNAHPSHGRDHAVFCIAAAYQLESLGITVHIQPPAIRIDQHSYEPDLLVQIERGTGDREIWLIECERGSGSSDDYRAAKWHNAISIQRRAYIITPDIATRDRLLEEVRMLGRPCQVYASDMAWLRNAQCVDDVWAIVREFE